MVRVWSTKYVMKWGEINNVRGGGRFKVHHKADNFLPAYSGYTIDIMYTLTLGASNGTTRNAQSRGALCKNWGEVPKNERTECDPSQFGRIILLYWNFYTFFYFFYFFLNFLNIFFTIFQLLKKLF